MFDSIECDDSGENCYDQYDNDNRRMTYMLEGIECNELCRNCCDQYNDDDMRVTHLRDKSIECNNTGLNV